MVTEMINLISDDNTFSYEKECIIGLRRHGKIKSQK